MNDDLAQASPPRLEHFFEQGSALKLVLRGHPYDFVNTYQVLRDAYGYRSHYVNLGFWRAELVDESAAMDPGTRLVRFLMERSGAARGGRVLDVGSGLGQGALDLQSWLDAEKVVGINVNPRQLAFANALATHEGKAARVHHQHTDACADLGSTLGVGSFDAAFAVECVGHFPTPPRFFQGLRAVLAPGAPFVCCLNIAKERLPLPFRAMVRMSYGFVPRPLPFWLEMLAASGFTLVEHGDITDAVLRDGVAAVRARLSDPELRARLPALTAALVGRQLVLTASAVERGSLGYCWIVAR